MPPEVSPQERMDAAFKNYFDLSNVLHADIKALLDGECNTQIWRRNFIRASTALIEGDAHCLREMCAVSFECTSPKITSKEVEVLHSEEGFSADERLKLTLRAAYKLFDLAPAPDFGGNEWPRARKVFIKRNLLMHPKTPSDLEVPDNLWSEIRDGVIWLMEKFFNFTSSLEQKYGG